MAMGSEESKPAGSDPAAYVNEVVTAHKVVVFSKTTCGYCRAAKKVLEKYPIKDKEIIELDKVRNGSAIQGAVAKRTGRRTVPNVIVGGKSIGGGDDVEDLHAKGKLDGILREAGAL
eukprot:TRINITY_DN162770_c0_g1_i2.p2 TRINITY_DN162770_c0_g1~~TRINITY_DN162770_c0_g1_i2.p2  ORF type:complete len:117 (-),score=26.01 TRINITY_DN162770_c0_g1_i2:91-441(-)